MTDLKHIVVPIALFGAIAMCIMALLNFILKMRIISSGDKDEFYIKILSNTIEKYKSGALKWGLLLLFGGMGLVLNSFIPGCKNFDSPLPFGIESVFLAIGFLVYYVLTDLKNKTD